MNFKYYAVAFLFVCLGSHSCRGKSIVPPNKSSGVVGTFSESTTTRRTYTCQCEETSKPLCANNGVTYQNLCRFDCAKHKVERLRVVKEGDCGKYLSKLQFWSFDG